MPAKDLLRNIVLVTAGTNLLINSVYSNGTS